MSERPGDTTNKGILSGKMVRWHLQWRIEKDDIMQVVFIKRDDLPLYYVRTETSFQAEWYREGGHDETVFYLKEEELPAVLDWLGARKFEPIDMENEGVPFYPMKYSKLYPSGLVVRHKEWETGPFSQCMMLNGKILKGAAFEEYWLRQQCGDKLVDEMIEEEKKDAAT